MNVWVCGVCNKVRMLLVLKFIVNKVGRVLRLNVIINSVFCNVVFVDND